MAKAKKDLSNKSTIGNLSNTRDITKDLNKSNNSKNPENRDKDDTNIQF